MVISKVIPLFFGGVAGTNDKKHTVGKQRRNETTGSAERSVWERGWGNGKERKWGDPNPREC